MNFLCASFPEGGQKKNENSFDFFVFSSQQLLNWSFFNSYSLSRIYLPVCVWAQPLQKQLHLKK